MAKKVGNDEETRFYKDFKLVLELVEIEAKGDREFFSRMSYLIIVVLTAFIATLKLYNIIDWNMVSLVIFIVFLFLMLLGAILAINHNVIWKYVNKHWEKYKNFKKKQLIES